MSRIFFSVFICLFYLNGYYYGPIPLIYCRLSKLAIDVQPNQKGSSLAHGNLLNRHGRRFAWSAKWNYNSPAHKFIASAVNLLLPLKKKYVCVSRSFRFHLSYRKYYISAATEIGGINKLTGKMCNFLFYLRTCRQTFSLIFFFFVWQNFGLVTYRNWDLPENKWTRFLGDKLM